MEDKLQEPQHDNPEMFPRTNPLIMAVDDNEEYLEELGNLLKLAHYDVITVSKGDNVLDEAVRHKPDLILLDLKMNPKSGFQIADEARKSIELNKIPIIAITGFFTEKQHLTMMTLCGIKSSILKPFRPLNLFSKIESAIGKNKLEEVDTDGT